MNELLNPLWSYACLRIGQVDGLRDTPRSSLHRCSQFSIRVSCFRYFIETKSEIWQKWEAERQKVLRQTRPIFAVARL